MRAALVLLALCIAVPVTAQPQVAASRLRGELDRAVRAGRIPGAAVRILRGDRTLVDVRTGYADNATRTPLARSGIVRLFSMSKPITSVAIMMLAEAGRLSLDDPAERWLPEWRGMRVYASGDVDHMTTVPVRRPVTIADLLSHTAGITYHFTGDTPVHRYYRRNGVMRDTPVGRTPGDGAPARTLDELVARLGKAPMLHQPGERFAYSYSTTMLGAIVERASGERLDRYLARHIFAPLKMRDTTFVVGDAAASRLTTLYAATPTGLSVVETPATSDYRNPARLLDGGGAIASTMDDYVRFARMLANRGEMDGVRLLTPASVAAMLVPRTTIGGLGEAGEPFGYGFAIGTVESRGRGGLPVGAGSWSGSGNTYFFFDPERRGVAVLMTSVLGGGEMTRDLRRWVDAAYHASVRD